MTVTTLILRVAILQTPPAQVLKSLRAGDNIVESTAGQVAAIRIDANATTAGIVVRDNLLRGDNRRVLVEGENRDKMTVQRNE